MYNYNAFVKRVVDGDTYDLVVDLGFQTQATIRARLRGIDTPETWRPSCDEELRHGVQATKFVKSWIENTTININSYKLGVYGRWEVDVFIEEDNKMFSLADLLVENNLTKREKY